ncbi:type IV pilus assembly protein PilM [Patescibacteria group bacterium]|nr:type IV pilus assembly protein PilM [Patescibacteria group bacterium]
MGIFSSNKNFVGVDIGTSGVKIVELLKSGNSVMLSNYGFSEKKIEKIDIGAKLDVDNIARSISEVLKKSKIQSRNVVGALPTFAVFSSVLSLKSAPEKSLDSAVRWEAKKIIPLPLDEMVLDWRKIEDPGVVGNEEKQGDDMIKVLITGAPKNLVTNYINIFKKAQLNLLSLETETFSLVRALVGNDKSPFLIVEVGANTTDISMIINSIPMHSRSIDIGGLLISRAVAGSLKVDIGRAEQFKCDLGLSSLDLAEETVPKTIKETLSPIVNEIKYALNLFKNSNDVEVEKIILSGGSSMLINFSTLLSKELDKKVVVGDPWARVIYPNDLRETLDQIGPKMAVAVGLAMRDVA